MEIRQKFVEFCKRHRLPVLNWTDETIRDFFQREESMRSGRPVRYMTRNARLHANGPKTPAPAPVTTPSVSDADQCRRRAQQVLDEHEAYERETKRKQLLLSSL